MYPDYVKSLEDKIAFCKSNTKNYNKELDLCVAECGIEETIDPITGDCSSLANIQTKIMDLQKVSDSRPFYFVLLLSLFIAFIICFIHEKKKTDEDDDKKLKIGLGIYAISLISVLYFFRNTISIIPLLGAQLFILYEIV